MADLAGAVQASKLMDLVRAAQRYDYDNKLPGNWQRVPDSQAAWLIVGALARLLEDLAAGGVRCCVHCEHGPQEDDAHDEPCEHGCDPGRGQRDGT